MIYLASPYSHPDPAVQLARYQKAMEYCVHAATERNEIIYSPIMHWHVASYQYNLPTDAQYWKYQNESLILHCSSIRVLMLDGWRESIGVQEEIGFAGLRLIPVHYTVGLTSWQ